MAPQKLLEDLAAALRRLSSHERERLLILALSEGDRVADSDEVRKASERILREDRDTLKGLDAD